MPATERGLSGGLNVMRQSLARGAALARQEAAEKEAARLAEENKMQTARAMMERRKSYGRVQRRAGSPAKAVSRKQPAKKRTEQPPPGSPDKAEKKRTAAPHGTPNKGGAKKKSAPPPRAPPPPQAPQVHEEVHAPMHDEVQGDDYDDDYDLEPVAEPEPEFYIPPPEVLSRRPSATNPPAPLLMAKPAPPAGAPPLVERFSAEELLAADGDDFDELEAMCLAEASTDKTSLPPAPVAASDAPRSPVAAPSPATETPPDVSGQAAAAAAAAVQAQAAAKAAADAADAARAALEVAAAIDVGSESDASPSPSPLKRTQTPILSASKSRDAPTGLPAGSPVQAAPIATSASASLGGGGARLLFDRQPYRASDTSLASPRHPPPSAAKPARRGIIAKSLPIEEPPPEAEVEAEAASEEEEHDEEDVDENAVATGDADEPLATTSADEDAAAPPLPISPQKGSKVPAARRKERGSLFARLRLGEVASPEPSYKQPAGSPAKATPGGMQVFGNFGGGFSGGGGLTGLFGGNADKGHGAAAYGAGSTAQQQLEAMSEQLEAVTACMCEEQRARMRAESDLRESREAHEGLVRQLGETERMRREEATTLAALRGLLEQIQGENHGLKDQNATLLRELRPLVSARGQ